MIVNRRLFYFYKNVLRFNLIQRFKFFNFNKEVPYLKHITVLMRSHNWSFDLEHFEKTLYFFRLLFSKKPIFNIIKILKKNPVKNYNLSAFFKIHLKKKAAFEFFELLFLFLPKMKKKYIKIFELYDKQGNHIVIIKDLTVFFSLGESFFKWPYPLVINFILKNSNNVLSSFVLKKHGFFLVN